MYNRNDICIGDIRYITPNSVMIELSCLSTYLCYSYNVHVFTTCNNHQLLITGSAALIISLQFLST